MYISRIFLGEKLRVTHHTFYILPNIKKVKIFGGRNIPLFVKEEHFSCNTSFVYSKNFRKIPPTWKTEDYSLYMLLGFLAQIWEYARLCATNTNIKKINMTKIIATILTWKNWDNVQLTEGFLSHIKIIATILTWKNWDNVQFTEGFLSHINFNFSLNLAHTT